MFAVDCPTTGQRTLIFASQVTAIRNTDTGIHVHFTCDCGEQGVWITGRGAANPGVIWLSDMVAA
jgi:hypothetical protein